MTIAETLLVFAAAPLAITAVLALLTLRPERGHKRMRYKPGQPWDHAPVWYAPHSQDSGSDGHGPAPSGGPAAVPGSSTAALGSSMYPEQPGERGLDSGHGAGVGAAVGAGVGAGAGAGAGVGAGAGAGARAGASAASLAGTAARRPHPGGPLGGARGTW